MRRFGIFFVLAALVCLLSMCFTAAPAQAQNFQTLYTFTGISPDGANPWNDPLLKLGGTLYGTTSVGGANGGGTVYKINSDGTETVLYSFCPPPYNCSDGWFPQSNVLPDWQGNLYGVALFGGDTTSTNCVYNFGCGVLYKLDTNGILTVLYTFTGGADGNIPQGLNMDWAGNLYGITFNGGDLSCPIPQTPPGCGTVYKFDTRGNFTVLYAFKGGADGAVPNDYLTLDWAGNIYGVTTAGGNTSFCSGNGCGTVFKLDRSGKLTTLHTFTGTDGSGANGSLVLDAWGNLYGTTNFGGDLTCNGGTGCGVAFKLTTARKYKVVHTFTGAPDGAISPMGLIQDWSGNLYGVTEWGGTGDCSSWSTAPPGCGTVFKLDATGHETVVYSFTGLADGASPGSALTMDIWGNLYGNTLYGGDFSCAAGFNAGGGCGVAYKIAAR